MTDVAALAEQLQAATDNRQPIPNLTASEPRLDEATAYGVQRAVIDKRVSAGETVIGYKLGLVSRAKQQAMGVSAPLWGWLTDGMVHPEEAPLDTQTLIHPRAESEIAFLIGRTIPGGTATIASVLAATEAVFPALEVLDSRYEDFRFKLPDVIADNGSAARVVLGGRVLPPSAVNLQLEGMVLRTDGEVVETAAGAAIAGHPAAAVAWLARKVGEIPEGAVILAGGLTAPVVLRAGSVISADFTTLGTVGLRCGP